MNLLSEAQQPVIEIPEENKMSQTDSFLLLRSKGYSVAKISKILKIPERTLFRWYNELNDKIKLLQEEKLNELSGRILLNYAAQYDAIMEQYKTIIQTMKSNPPVFLNYKDLLNMSLKILDHSFEFNEKISIAASVGSSLPSAQPEKP